jgi:ribosomal protein S18 acetylase RimI-like enzyme
MDLKLVADYRDDKALRHSFNELTQTIFKFDLESWYSRGYWTGMYVCHTLMDGTRAAANVSVAKQDFLVQGELKKAIQVGTVMTHPDYRGLGLAGKLMDHAIERYSGNCDFMFLVANKSVLDFYPRYGFTRIGMNTFTYFPASQGSPLANLRRLSPANSEDLATIERLARDRAPVSPVFAPQNDWALLMFHLTGPYAEGIYYLPDYDALVVMNVEAGAAEIFDIISPRPFRQSDMVAAVLPPDVSKVQLHFTPDDSLAGVVVGEWVAEDGLFIRPASFSLPRPFCFSPLSQS